ncbi:hypothetical protein F5X96DRAFT_663887 [Biscogniauxia mediterranea]|nr:hypothetical protein F5X96DRAFT_663887 [Biscogniauxia mediterranea]
MLYHLPTHLSIYLPTYLPPHIILPYLVQYLLCVEPFFGPAEMRCHACLGKSQVSAILPSSPPLFLFCFVLFVPSAYESDTRLDNICTKHLGNTQNVTGYILRPFSNF